MSRIGKLPIPLPPKVEVKIDGNLVTVKGPHGELTQEVKSEIKVGVEDGQVICSALDEKRQTRAYHGLYRALIYNMVHGVAQKFFKELTIVGVGYKVELKGKEIHLQVGYSNPKIFPLPDGITAEVEPKALKIKISGINKELVGQTAANIRRIRPPEPYKGKGIRYSNEHVRRKAGKASGKK